MVPCKRGNSYEIYHNIFMVGPVGGMVGFMSRGVVVLRYNTQ